MFYKRPHLRIEGRKQTEDSLEQKSALRIGTPPDENVQTEMGNLPKEGLHKQRTTSNGNANQGSLEKPF